MAQEKSFDFVSKVNLQELRNAIQQAQKELGTRFDFRNTSASIVFEEAPPLLKLTADHQGQLRSVVDVLETKMSKRGVSTKVWDWKAVEALPSGSVKQQAGLRQGLTAEVAKEIVRAIKDLGLKVQPRIEGETIRVSGKQIDDLQAVIRAIQAKEFGVPIQVENYR